MIDERYARAVQSSHLQCTEEPGDIDALIAAGLVRDGIGVDLLRLRTDYDAISDLPGGRRGISLLKRMPAARERVQVFALRLAEQQPGDVNVQRVRAVALRVLELWLDPTCGFCDGTGMVGEYGTVRQTCSTCNGSKRRRLCWEAPEDEAFAAKLAERIEDRVDTARRVIRRFLRTS